MAVFMFFWDHEASNIYGDLRNVTAADYASFANGTSERRRHAAFEEYMKIETLRGRTPDRTAWMSAHPPGFAEHREAFSPKGKYGRWLRSLPAILKIGDTVFLHGGISPDLPVARVEKVRDAVRGELKLFDACKQYMVDQKIASPLFTLDELVAAAKNEVGAIRAAAETRKGRAPGSRERDKLTRLEGFLGYGSWLSIHPDGPLWFRGYDTWSEAEGQTLAHRIIESLQAGRLVVGHTPQAREIRSRFGGKVFLIDTGMLSSAYTSGRASALEIANGSHPNLRHPIRVEAPPPK